jgi:PAS domain S-box-containing protein
MSARDCPDYPVSTKRDEHTPKEHILLPHRTGEYFETLLKQMPDGVLLTDPKGSILRANHSFYSMFGYRIGDLKGKYIQELMPDSIIQKEITSNFEKLARGELGKVEASRKRKDGSSIDVMIHGGPILDGEKMEAVFIIYMDITARKEMERSLRKSQERFSLAMDATEDGLWDWDLRTDHVYYSPKYETMLGYAPGEMDRKIGSWVERIHPEDRDKVLNINHFHIDGSPAGFQVEYRMKRKDGKWQWVQGKGKVVERDEEGTPLRMIGTHRNISDRVKREKILKENESRFRSLFENSPVSLWEEDWRDIRKYISGLKRKGISDFTSYFNNDPEAVKACINLIKVLKVNKATADLLELPAEEILPLKHLGEVASESSFSTFRNEFITVATGKTHYKGEFSFKTWRGIEKTAILHLDIPPGYEKDLSKVIISVYDITDHKKTEQELLQEKLNWELMFQNSPQGIVITDEKEKILRANRKFCEMFGFSEEEVAGLHVNEIVSGPHPSRKEAERISEKLNRGENIDLQTVRHTRDGKLLNMDIQVIPINNYYGEKIYYGIYKDITENVRISLALKQSEQFNASLLKNARHPIVVYEPDLSVRYVNPAFTELTGFEEQELLGVKPPYPWWPSEH